jgi:Kef-type K+ transport system membrane component KefB
LGVVFFLFVIGLELDLRQAWSLRRYALGIGVLQVAVTGILLMLYWRWFSESWSLGLLLGLVLANSSTALVIQILERKNELDQEHGQASFAVLLFQDLTVVPIIALVPLLAGTGSTDVHSLWQVLPAVGAVALLFFVGRKICPWLFGLASEKHMSETFTAVLFIAVLGSAWVASRMGLSMALGAFLMGVALSGTEQRHQLRNEVMSFKNLLLGLFFVAVGLTVDVSVLTEHPVRILMHVLVIVVVKVAVLYLAARRIRLRHPGNPTRFQRHHSRAVWQWDHGDRADDHHDAVARFHGNSLESALSTGHAGCEGLNVLKEDCDRREVPENGQSHSRCGSEGIAGVRPRSPASESSSHDRCASLLVERTAVGRHPG